jgi:hypothetical protein
VPEHVTIIKGTCFALFAYDIGLSINLTDAGRRILAGTERGRLRHRTRAPQYFEYRPAPLRLVQEGSIFDIGHYQVRSAVEVMVYDLGAVTITYRFPIDGPFNRLLELSELLYENERLLAESRTRVEQLIQALGPSVERPSIAEDVEDYIIFGIESCVPEKPPLWTRDENYLAQILRAERTPLSEQEVADAVSCRISFGQEDAAVIDWHSAVLFGQEMDDVRAVLEFANVELLEMRILDEQLDRALDEGYEALSRKPHVLSLPGSHEKDLTHIAHLQVDSALLFERITNTLKLLGDQYLARVYRLVSQRFHLEAWDASILRKLQTLESIYGKMSDRAGTRRMEVLEWIIIILITLSIAIPFLPMGGAH